MGGNATVSSTTFNPLRNANYMAEMIATVTGQPISHVMDRLRAEYKHPCSSVAADFQQRGLVPYVWGDGMAQFYSQTDAFLYELAVWNRNALKSRMRRWMLRYLASHGRKLDVLCFGDGLGFDGLAIARAGHRVTYFEVPGYSESFARLLFEKTGTHAAFLTSMDAIPSASFDAVQCLDVLEHVPDPSAAVRMLAGYLRPGGVLLVHAPFYFIHPSNPTHLAANRRYSGSLELFTKEELTVIGGTPLWNPIVLQKNSPEHSSQGGHISVRQRIAGVYYALGRWTALPFLPVTWYRWLSTRWFG